MDVATVRRYAKDKMTGEEMWVVGADSVVCCAYYYPFLVSRINLHSTMDMILFVVINLASSRSILLLRTAFHETMFMVPFIPATYPCSHYRALGWLSRMVGTLPARVCLLLAILFLFFLTTLLAPVMRYKESLEQAIYLREASDQGRLEMIYSGLDVLGSTPWKINEDIFGVVLKVWNSGERFLKLPPAVYDGPEPQLPPGMENDARAKATYSGQLREWNQEKANCHSQRCSVNYKLEIARSVCFSLIFRHFKTYGWHIRFLVKRYTSLIISISEGAHTLSPLISTTLVTI